MSGDTPLPPPPPGSVPHESRPTTPAPPPPPNGYVAYGATGVSDPRLYPVRTMRTWAMIATGVAGVASAVGALVSASLASTAQDFLDGEVSEQEFLDANVVAPLVQALGFVPLVAAAVFTMIWMFRISTNVRTIGRRTTFHPVFAIVGWFLPPFLFVLPLLIMRELWKASDPETPVGNEGWRSTGENPLLYLWFVLYGLIPLVLTVVSLGAILDSALNLDTDTESIAEVTAATGGAQLIASGVVTLLGAVAWIAVVRAWTERHTRLTNET